MKKRNKKLLWALPILLLAVVLWLYGWLFYDLPDPDDLSAYTTAPSSKIYDRYGRLLYEMPPPYTGSHTPVPLTDVPPALIWATIATEDATFYTNPGLDAWAILRAVWINVQGGEVLSGGSTITQQLVRTVMFEPNAYLDRSLRRKLRELIVATRLTRRYSKDAILALYLNETYYGAMAYGVEAAAQTYFGKPVRDLDGAECALLAGLPQAPAIYNPLENLPAARERQAVVLDLMVKQGYLSAADADLAKREELAFASAPFPIRAPHFVMMVRGLLEEELGLERLQVGGLRIHTTLDVDLTDAARDLMRHRLELLATCHYAAECPPGGHNVRNAAVVALDPTTGEILALVGSPDYFAARIDGAVNGATAPRQPGSAIKPLTYAAAFARGDFTPATMLLDVRTAFVTQEGAPYVPLNYDLEFRGPVRLREALASSYNIIAVKVLDAIGVDALLTLARQMGITTFDKAERIGLALTLGGGEVRLLELTAAYAAFANGGTRTTPVAVRRVEDATGTVIWQPDELPAARVLDERVAYLISDILSDDLARAPTFGEGSALTLAGRPAAVKTGTTTDFRDNWTVGYTPDLVVGVWVGNADNEAMKDVSGVSGAAPLWRDVIAAALKGTPVRDFARPEGLVDVTVCAVSGLRPNPDCPHRVTETFIAGAEPTQTCDLHQEINGALYTVLPPEAHEWAREHGLPQPADALPPDAAVPASAALRLTHPDHGSVYRLDPALPRAEQRIAVVVETDAACATVTLLLDGAPLHEWRSPPYRRLWSLTPGEHTFSVACITAEGASLTGNAVTITVQE